MSVQEGPVLPAPSDDPFWSTFRVNPYSRMYLGSLEGQKKYESLWQSLRSVFDQTEVRTPTEEGPFLRWDVRAHAEWHEPSWQHPRIEQGDETCLVRKDFIVGASSNSCDGGEQQQQRREEDADEGSDARGEIEEVVSGSSSGRDALDVRPSRATSSSASLAHLDPASLMALAERLARSDLVGMGRLRCACRGLRDACYLPATSASGSGKMEVFRPLVSFSTAYVAEVPVRGGGQLYAGTFLLPVRACDFPALQNWFSSALSESLLDGACRLLCHYMPNCFEFVSGCGLGPPHHAPAGFHATLGVHAAETGFPAAPLECVSYVCCIAPRLDDRARMSLWLT